MSKLTFDMVQAQAKTLGLVIEEDHIGDDQPGYWMLDPVTGEGPWEDENFSASLEEVVGKLCAIKYQREEDHRRRWEAKAEANPYFTRAAND